MEILSVLDRHIHHSGISSHLFWRHAFVTAINANSFAIVFPCVVENVNVEGGLRAFSLTRVARVSVSTLLAFLAFRGIPIECVDIFLPE